MRADQVAKGFIQLGLENQLDGRRLHSLWPIPLPGWNFYSWNFSVSIVSHPATTHHSEEPDSIFLMVLVGAIRSF